MAVDFLTDEQKARYGQYYEEISDVQLARYFYLDKSDINFIQKRRGEQNRLGFALQLTSVRYLGTYIFDVNIIPNNVQDFVAKQLSITDLTILQSYAQREVTKREHNALIRKQYGYQELREGFWSFRLNRLLYTQTWVNNERPSLMFDFATGWLVQNKVLLPGISTLTRLIAEIRERAMNKLWLRISSLPNNEQIEKLEALLTVQDGQRASEFDKYRKGPTAVSSPAFNIALARYLELKDFGISQFNFDYIPPIRLKNLARHAGVISMHKIARMPVQKRIAILVAFVKTFETIALDDAIDILDMLITKIAGEAKKLGKKKRLRTLKDLDKSALRLASICALILDDETEDIELRDVIFSKVSKEQLTASIDTINKIARPIDDNFQKEMVEQYGKVTRFLPRLLNDIKVKAAPSGEQTIEAFNYLVELGRSRSNYLEDPPLSIVSKPWQNLVFEKDGKINRKAYTLCFLDKFQDSLRRRDIYIENSDRWGDPRVKLIRQSEWQVKRLQVCRSLGHPVRAKEAIEKLKTQLDSTYKQVAAKFDENDAVELDYSGKRPSLTISNLEKLEDSPSLDSLSEQVADLLPKVDLTELLLEINAHTDFLSEFTHVSESNAKADELTTSICAVLIAEACNIGLEAVIKPNTPALTRHRLSWVKQNYIRADTLTKSNALLVNFQLTLSLAQKWGGGEVASADGMRFVVPVRTVNAGPNKKYYGASKGITWYNFMSNQYSGFHGIVIPGTLRDSMFVLEGILEQQTRLQPTEIMTDTTGSSDIVFGLFWLLGYQFSPRLADAGEAVFWRIDEDEDYGVLNEIARGQINLSLIEEHWDDMMRIAGSLKLGTIQASELIRTLLKSDRPSSLAKAIIEAGRINRTIYLLNYIDDEEYRRKILTQLNRGEARHAVARAICHGQRGEIRKRYREGQEDQLGVLGLVINAVILWNTMYMESALKHLHTFMEIKEEDESRLSPLGSKHINVLGHYSFILNELVTKGTLRPLNLNDALDSIDD